VARQGCLSLEYSVTLTDQRSQRWTGLKLPGASTTREACDPFSNYVGVGRPKFSINTTQYLARDTAAADPNEQTDYPDVWLRGLLSLVLNGMRFGERFNFRSRTTGLGACGRRKTPLYAQLFMDLMNGHYIGQHIMATVHPDGAFTWKQRVVRAVWGYNFTHASEANTSTISWCDMTCCEKRSLSTKMTLIE